MFNRAFQKAAEEEIEEIEEGAGFPAPSDVADLFVSDLVLSDYIVRMLMRQTKSEHARKDLFEVSLQQALECLAVSCLVTSHLMNCIMDRIKIQSLSLLCELCLAGCSAILSVYADTEIFLCGVCQDFAEKFSKLCSMLSFLEGSAMIIIADFRIAFTECCT